MSKFLFDCSFIIHMYIYWKPHEFYILSSSVYGTLAKKSIRIIDACFRVFSVFAYIHSHYNKKNKLSFVHFPSQKYGLTCEIKGVLVTHIRNRFFFFIFNATRNNITDWRRFSIFRLAKCHICFFFFFVRWTLL